MKIQRSMFAALVATLLVAGAAFAAQPTTLPFNSSHTPNPHSSQAARPSESAHPSKSAEASEPAESAEPSESAGAPSDAELTRILADLQAAGITTTLDELKALAAKVGLGEAVRVLVFAHASGQTPDQILAMFESGKGWGEVAKELDLTIGPGIGGIMSGGHGKPSSAPNTPAHGHDNGHNPHQSAPTAMPS